MLAFGILFGAVKALAMPCAAPDHPNEASVQMAEIENSTKRCPTCGETKPCERFGRHPRSRDRLNYICKACQAAHDSVRHAAFRLAHPEVVKARKAAAYRRNDAHCKAKAGEYRTANRARLSANNAVRYAQNKQQILADIAAWRAANPDRVKARQLAWQRNHRSRVKAINEAWKRANPDAIRAYGHKRRARQYASVESWSAADIRDIRRLQRDQCAACRTRLRGKGHIDHIIALTNGGTNGRRNIQLLCQPCNNAKHVKDPIDWMRSRGFLL